MVDTVATNPPPSVATLGRITSFSNLSNFYNNNNNNHLEFDQVVVPTPDLLHSFVLTDDALQMDMSTSQTTARAAASTVVSSTTTTTAVMTARTKISSFIPTTMSKVWLAAPPPPPPTPPSSLLASPHPTTPLSSSSSSSSSTVSSTTSTVARDMLQRGTRLGATSLGFLMVAYSLTMPHQQARRDALGCDSLCLGSMTSARSTLKLVGAAVMGRVSDSTIVYHKHHYSARLVCLWIGFAAAAVALVSANQSNTLSGLWWSMIPEALEQNVHIFKALLGEYQSSRDVTGADRAASAGSLGASMGLAMMVGPLVGSMVSYEQATGLAVAFLVLATSLVARIPIPERSLPPPSPTSSSVAAPSTTSTKQSWWKFLDVPSARSPPALFLLTCRLVSTLAFHIYQTILPISLRNRFDFGPSDYGKFFSCVGLFFALSQGVLAKRVLQWIGGTSTSSSSSTSTARQRVRLIVTCSVIVTLTRYVGLFSHNVVTVYAIFALMVTAYGIMSTLIAADTTQIAAPHELGSFFGLIATVESGAGMVGPLLGGAMNAVFSKLFGDGGTATATASSSLQASLWTVMVLNGIGTVLLAWGYERLILANQIGDDSKAKTE